MLILRIIFPVALFLVIQFPSMSQDISLSYEKGDLYITNSSSLTYHITIDGPESEDDHIFFIQAQSRKHIKFPYTTKRARLTRVKAEYDLQAFNYDLRRIEEVRKRREDRQRNKILWQAFARFLDEVYTGGVIFGVKDVYDLSQKAKQGQNIDKDFVQFMEGLAATNVSDDKLLNGTISASYYIYTALSQAKSIQTDDLDLWFRLARNEFNRSSIYFTTVDNEIPSPGKQDLPLINVEIFQPFLTDLIDGDNEFPSLQQSKILGSPFPIGFRSSIEFGEYWSKKEKEYFILYGFVEHMRTRMVQNPSTSPAGPLFFQQGLQIINSGLGVGVKYGKEGFFAAMDIGAFHSVNQFHALEVVDGEVVSSLKVYKENQINAIASINIGVGNLDHGVKLSMRLMGTTVNGIETPPKFVSLGIYSKVYRLWWR